MLVGAAAIFVGFTPGISEIIKFAALVILVVGLYGGGLLLHLNVAKVRPAAVAFVGSGLALIPFVGLAFYNYILPDASLAWWLTSVLGFAAFWLALLRIRAQILSYVSIAFVFSLSTSTVSILDLPIVWYFVAVIVTSSLLMLIGHKKSDGILKDLALPLEQNAQLATPVALIGSLFLFNSIGAIEYTLITGVGALHYAVNALSFYTDKTRYIYWTLARSLTVVFALFLTYHFSQEPVWLGLTLLVAGILTHIYSLHRLHAAKDNRELGWLAIVQIFLIVTALLWQDTLLLTSGASALLFIVSVQQLLQTHRSEYFSGGIIALLAFPFVFAMALNGDSSIATSYLSLIALILACSLIGIRMLRQVYQTDGFRLAMTAGYSVLLAQSIIYVLLQTNLTWIGAIFATVAFVVYYISFIEKQPVIHLGSNILAVIGAYFLLKEAGVMNEWLVLGTAWIAALLWYALRWYFDLYEDGEPDTDRIDIMFGSAFTVLVVGALYSSLAFDSTVVAASLTGCIAAAILAYEGYVRKNYYLYEAAIAVFTIALQRLIYVTYPGASLLVYTHWWAFTSAAIAALRLQRGEREGARVRGVITLVILSVPTGLFALSDPDSYQLLFLLEHVALLVAGFVLQKKLVLLWSAVAIGLAVLWLLSSYTYILLILISLGLIALAIWRLARR